MTDPLGGQSAATGTGQSAGTGTEGTGAAANTDNGQSAVTPPAGAQPDSGQSAVSRTEFDRVVAQLAAADKKRAEAEAAHAQLRDKDMPQLQKLERDLAEATKVREELTNVNQALRVENAFLSANEHQWHDPGAALKLLDRSKITVDADGNVAGMKDALKALATANPWLVKPAPAEGQGQGTTPPPGTSPANGGIAPPQGTTPDKAALAAKYPALRQKL